MKYLGKALDIDNGIFQEILSDGVRIKKERRERYFKI